MNRHRRLVQPILLPLVLLLALASAPVRAQAPDAAATADWMPTTLDGITDPAGWPVQFETISIDVGRVPASEELVATFKFENVSGRRIEPVWSQGRCGGWSVRWNKPAYAPGEGGEVVMTCRSPTNLRRRGPARRVFSLPIPGFENERMAIETRVHWIPEIIEPPRTIFPRTLRGRKSVAVVQVAGRAADFQVTAVTPREGTFNARVIAGPEVIEAEGEEYRAYSIEIELPADAPVGYISDSIKVSTNETRLPECRCGAGGEVVGEVFVGGDRRGMSCEVQQGEVSEASVNLVSWSGRPFRVTGIETVADERFAMEDVELEVTAPSPQAELGGHATLALRARLLNPDRLWWVGWASVTTDVPGEEPLKVSIYLHRPRQPIDSEQSKPAEN